MKVVSTLLLSLVTCGVLAQSQLITREDSLTSNASRVGSTVISGYGEASFQRDNYLRTAGANLTRAVFFIGHRFNSKISFFSELEMENAKTVGGTSGGEIAFEQAFLKFNVNRNAYFVAGLFIPRLGILNEDHLPINYLGTERTLVETKIIPSTWRELGIGYYAKIPNTFLSYSVALVNGLDSRKFTRYGFRDAKMEGQNASMNNLAVTGSLRYYRGGLRLQIAGYSGGTSAMSWRAADSLALNSGAFGSPIHIGIFDAIYRYDAWSAKFLASYVSIPDAEKINNAFANQTPKAMLGTYVELGYDMLFNRFKGDRQLIAFARYEYLDMNAKMYTVGGINIKDNALSQQHIILGANYLPIPNVILKADIRVQITGSQNSDLILNPSPVAQSYQTRNSFVNLGVGYAF